MGDPLINRADEVRRERVLSHREERRLLDACLAVSRDRRQRWSHLRPFIIAALDTACRRGELFKLRWRDVDLSSRTITIIAANCKTERPRTVGITPRLLAELPRLWEASTKDVDGLVFGLGCTVKSGWRTLCRLAEIEGLRLHDLRHTSITRLVGTGQPSTLLMKVSGHTQPVTFLRYLNPDAEAVVRVADALDALNSGTAARAAAILEELHTGAEPDVEEVSGMVN